MIVGAKRKSRIDQIAGDDDWRLKETKTGDTSFDLVTKERRRTNRIVGRYFNT